MAKVEWKLGPVAHRGWHDVEGGVIENTVSAFERALEAGLAIECDLQAAKGDEPVVFHDRRLHRLTHGDGLVIDHSIEELRSVKMRGTNDRIQSFGEFLDMVGGRVPLLIEVKTDWGQPGNYERNIAKIMNNYKGPAGLMSFDPQSVKALRKLCPNFPVGLVAGAPKGQRSVPMFSPAHQLLLKNLIALPGLRLDFVAYNVKALPTQATRLVRHVFGLPLFTWTVRSEDDRQTALTHADAPIFEGPLPSMPQRSDTA